MMEILLEYALSVIDYTYLLYFYLMLIGKKWELKVNITSILLISVLQLCKENLIDFGGFSSFLDFLLVITFLYIIGRKYSVTSFWCAITIHSVFYFTIVFAIALMQVFFVEVNQLRLFTTSRYLFALLLKTTTIVILILTIKPLSKMINLMVQQTTNFMIIIVFIISMGLSYIYGNSIVDDKIIIYTIIMLMAIVFVYYLFFKYSQVLNKQNDNKLIETTKQLTMKQIENVELEHDHIKKIRHDMKNQLIVLYELQKDQKYQEVLDILKTLSNDLEKEKAVVSGNIYIDAVLRQKMIQYHNIEFELNLSISPDFKMEGKDIISLLTNIIDNACEELNRINGDRLFLSMKGNESELRIAQKNVCSKDCSFITNKDKEYHGLGLKIIEEIVRKYDGEIDYDKDDDFHLSILLLF